MKVGKENKEWLKQYAQSHGISEEDALNKLLDETRQTQEAQREQFQKEIIERLPNLTFEQMREVRQLVEKFAPTFENLFANIFKQK